MSQKLRTFINYKKGDLYQIVISKKENMIENKYNNIVSDTEVLCSLIITSEEIIKNNSFNNLNDIFDNFKEIIIKNLHQSS